MTEALLFDCGGVFVAPTEGDWLLPPGYEDILGADFARDRLAEFRRAREDFLPLLPDAMRIDTDEREREAFARYYQAVFAAMGMAISPEAAEKLARAQVYIDERYILFEDVLPFLAKWRERYRIGIVSDAPPSTRRILQAWGVLDFVDFATFSCDLGVLKPDARIYQNTLEGLRVPPERALFLDDYPSRLRGGVAVGMNVAQIRRRMPPLFDMPPLWEGDVFRSFAELDAWLAGQNAR